MDARECQRKVHDTIWASTGRLLLAMALLCAGQPKVHARHSVLGGPDQDKGILKESLKHLEQTQLSGLPIHPTPSTQAQRNATVLRTCDLQCPRLAQHEEGAHLWCNSLDWDAPLFERICEHDPTACSGSDGAEEDARYVHRYLSSIGAFSLVVHYLYHEAEDMSQCELTNKRTNLEFFIANAVMPSSKAVQFYFDYSGQLPSVHEYFRSIGIAKKRKRIFPDLPNVHHQEVDVSRTDLCSHGRFLRQHSNSMQQTGAGDFVLLLNDGVRGPWFAKDHRLWSARAGLMHTGIPAWFVPFLAKYARNPNAMMVATMLSTELDGHLQSYALSFQSSVMSSVGAVMEATCPNFIGKFEAIMEGELGVSRSILEMGFSIASLWPRVDNFTKAHAQCSTALASEVEFGLEHKDARDMTCYPTDDSLMDFVSGHCIDRVLLGYHLLNRRNNPSTIYSGPWEKVVFVKYGGEVFRKGQLDNDFLEEVRRKTRIALGIQHNSSDGCMTT